MKKSILIFAAICLVAAINPAHAQKPTNPIEIGTWTANAGIGVGNVYGNGGGTGFGIKAAVERGMWQAGPGVITIGGELGWAHSSNKWIVTTSYNQFAIAARGAWHYGWNVEGLDTYGGISLGPAFRSWSYPAYSVGAVRMPSYSDNDVVFYFAPFIGASYYFTPNWGVNAELGYTTTIFQIGAVYRF